MLIRTLALALSLFTLKATDWPQWRGPSRDGHVSAGEKVPDKLPSEPKALWRIKIGNGFASPIVSKGKVFYSDNQEEKEVLHALEADNGKVIWRAVVDNCFKDAQGPSGPRCTPLVDGDRVYAQSCKGEFQCLNTSDGKVIWRTNFTNDFGAVFIGEKGQAAGGSRHGNTATPLIDGDRIIVMVGGKDGNSVVCFNKKDGTVIWHSGNDQTAYAPPIIATLGGKRQVVIFNTVALLGLDPNDGKELWRVPVNTGLGRHVTTPVVFNDIVSVASHQAGLIGVQIAPGADGLKAMQIWTNKTAAINFSSPVTIGESLYGLGPAKNLICVDLKDGQIKWSKEGYFNSSADKAHASFIVMGDKLLVLTDGGELALFKADPQPSIELSRVQVCGNTWCNPAYAEGRLYLRDAKELICLELAQ